MLISATQIGSGRCAVLVAKVPAFSMLTSVLMAPYAVTVQQPGWGQDYFAPTEGAPPLTPEREKLLVDRSRRTMAGYTSYVEQRRAEPGDDLISALIHTRTGEGDPALSTEEVIATLSADIETTAIFIPLVLRQLLSDCAATTRRERQRAVAEGGKGGLEDLPAGAGVRRTSMRDTEVGGVPIPAGADLFAYHASANFDDKVFGDPARFDIDRPDPGRHLFG